MVHCPPLLHVNHGIRNEASATYFETNTFYYSIDEGSSGTLEFARLAGPVSFSRIKKFILEFEFPAELQSRITSLRDGDDELFDDPDSPFHAIGSKAEVALEMVPRLVMGVLAVEMSEESLHVESMVTMHYDYRTWMCETCRGTSELWRVMSESMHMLVLWLLCGKKHVSSMVDSEEDVKALEGWEDVFAG